MMKPYHLLKRILAFLPLFSGVRGAFPPASLDYITTSLAPRKSSLDYITTSLAPRKSSLASKIDFPDCPAPRILAGLVLRSLKMLESYHYG